MRVACIFLTLDRPELSLRCIQQNFFNAGVDADVFLVDNGSKPASLDAVADACYPFAKVKCFTENIGIASALNAGIEMAAGYDAIVTLANDILMPKGWLAAMIEHAERIPETGMIGIHCVESLPPITDRGVHEIFTPFGNAMIPRKALDAAGYFNQDFDPYGMQDADYAFRLNRLGFISYYLPGLTSEHIGPDVGQDTEYRAAKDASLAKAGDVWAANTARYDAEKNYYVPKA
jgi:GT2 family glycosyltransferase